MLVKKPSQNYLAVLCQPNSIDKEQLLKIYKLELNSSLEDLKHNIAPREIKILGKFVDVTLYEDYGHIYVASANKISIYSLENQED